MEAVVATETRGATAMQVKGATREMKAEMMPEPSGEARPILVMDRQALTVATLADVLRRAGFAVTGATSGAEALLHARSTAHALAIIDQAALDAEGQAHAAEWARLAVPLMFMSADDTRDRIQRAVDAGAVGYFLKPVDPVQLVPAVHVALSRSREHSALAAEVNRLRDVVNGDNEIGVAVGVLMAQRGVPRRVAFETLRQHARRSRLRLGVVASEIASLATRLNDIPSIPPAQLEKVANRTTKRPQPVQRKA